MKFKVLLVGFAALVSVSTAVAAPPTDKGNPHPTTGVGCKPQVTVVLRGTFTSASTTSLTMTVVGANHWGKAWKTAGTASVTLDTKTKVRGNGMKAVTDLSKMTNGDRVLVQARSCKADLASNAMPALTAVRVVGHPAKA
jgi:hypothetical protein